jgi:hypothetical protein
VAGEVSNIPVADVAIFSACPGGYPCCCAARKQVCEWLYTQEASLPTHMHDTWYADDYKLPLIAQ